MAREFSPGRGSGPPGGNMHKEAGNATRIERLAFRAANDSSVMVGVK